MATDDETNPKSSKTVGDLVSRIVSTLRPEDGVTEGSVTKPNASEITTSAEEQPVSIGARLGGSGFSVVTQTTLPNPAEVLSNPMRWMPISLRGSLAKTYRDKIDPVYGFDSEHTGYRLARPADPEARQEAVRILSAALEPGPPREILTQLRRLRVMVVGGEQDATMSMAVYARELMNVPAAAVELAITDWVSSHRLWPPFADLRELIDKRLTLSRQLLEALK